MTNKLVFMFIVREGLLQPRLWEAFFGDADPDRYDCYYLSIKGPIKGCPEPDIANLVPISPAEEPRYAHVSYVEAVLTMLARGMEDPRAYKFILLSESCIPLVSFDTLYDRVMGDEMSYLYHFRMDGEEEEGVAAQAREGYPDAQSAARPGKVELFAHFFGPNTVYWVDRRYAEIRDTTGLRRERFHKYPAQGVCFQRAFAEFLLATREDLENFTGVRSIEEFYYLCPLNKRGIPFERHVRRENLMSFSWWGCRPKEYTELTPALVDRMRGWDYCFMRKVAARCVIDEPLIDHILERRGGEG